jgi:hypothetical protein
MNAQLNSAWQSAAWRSANVQGKFVEQDGSVHDESMYDAPRTLRRRNEIAGAATLLLFTSLPQ